MDSPLKQLLEENKKTSKDSVGIENSINMPVRITDYSEDGLFLFGTNLSNGESVKVFLRNVERKTTTAEPRPEIADFKNKKHSRYCEKNNSIVCCEGAFFDEEKQAYNARWISTLTSQKYKGNVFINDAIVNLVPKSDNNEFNKLSVDMIGNSSIIKSKDEFDAFMLQAFTKKSETSNNYIAIIIEDIVGQKLSIKAYPKKIEKVIDDEKIKVMDDNPYNSLNEFYSNERNKNNINILLASLSQPEQFTVKCIVLKKLYAGEKTVSKTFSGKNADLLKQKYDIKKEDKTFIGFRKTIIAVRQRPDGTYFATYIRNLTNDNSQKLIEDYDVN